MLENDTIKGQWYVHSQDAKLVVDHEGYTVADAHNARLAKQIVREHNINPELLAALKRMDGLVEKLWKSVPWGQTFNLPVQELNEAPLEAKRVIQRATSK